MTLKVLDLFSGIGGFSLGLEMAGPFETVAFVEIDPFCQKVLKHHWSEVPIYDDIKKIQWVVADSERFSGNRQKSKEVQQRKFSDDGNRIQIELSRIDLLTGGFPCQPFSCAGKRTGTEDDRYLWPEMLRAIHEIKPRWVLAENVPGLLTLQDGLVFEGVLADLENKGYEVQPLIIPACAQGAPHRRDRVWIVAHASDSIIGRSQKRWTEANGKMDGGNGTGKETMHISPKTQKRDRHAPDTAEKGLQGICKSQQSQRLLYAERGNWQEHWYEVATRFCRVDDGVPNRVDRLKSLGNAVVPKIVCEIGRAILQVEGLI